MEQAWVRITDPIGLHARPAAILVQTVGRYPAHVWLEHGERRAEGRSIVQLLTLGVRLGSRVRVCAEGPGAAVALAAVLNVLIAEPEAADDEETAAATNQPSASNDGDESGASDPSR
jgi:phosphotransferase system HPr (HPr) family protein